MEEGADNNGGPTDRLSELTPENYAKLERELFQPENLKRDENGKVVLDEKGKVVYEMKRDKTPEVSYVGSYRDDGTKKISRKKVSRFDGEEIKPLVPSILEAQFECCKYYYGKLKRGERLLAKDGTDIVEQGRRPLTVKKDFAKVIQKVCWIKVLLNDTSSFIHQFWDERDRLTNQPTDTAAAAAPQAAATAQAVSPETVAVKIETVDQLADTKPPAAPQAATLAVKSETVEQPTDNAPAPAVKSEPVEPLAGTAPGPGTVAAGSETVDQLPSVLRDLAKSLKELASAVEDNSEAALPNSSENDAVEFHQALAAFQEVIEKQKTRTKI